MENSTTGPVRLAKFYPLLKVLLVLVTGLVFLVWWQYTPPGLLGKADAAAYAVCHRITSHSILFGDQQMPLCARCSGMYLGALLGILYLGLYGKRSGMPSLKVAVVFILFFIAFGVDGLNSYLHFFPGMPGLYQPDNILRVITGTGVGLGIAAVLVPVLHQVLWKQSDKRRALEGWTQLMPLLGLAALLDLALLSEDGLIIYPLALLSAVTIFLVLAMVYTLVWIMIFKRENQFQRYREIWVSALAGLLTALIQIGAFDALRFWLTHTWNGFSL